MYIHPNKIIIDDVSLYSTNIYMLLWYCFNFNFTSFLFITNPKEGTEIEEFFSLTIFLVFSWYLYVGLNNESKILPITYVVQYARETDYKKL